MRFEVDHPKPGILGKITRGLGRGLVYAVAPVGFVVGANAADLDSTFFKAPPVQPDLTWHGITIIGAIDVAGQYNSLGAPTGSIFSSSSQILPQSRNSQWIIAPDQSAQSYIGVKVDQKLTNDLSFIARLESGFSPTSGYIADGLKTLQQANGVPLNQQPFVGDSSRAGQIFNGEAWAGFDANKWGVLHVGRNNVVSADMLFAYDPLISYGFSLFGWVGTVGGQGTPETARLDESVKYLNSYGPFRVELIYGAPGTNVNKFYQGSVGIVRPEFSVDIFGGRSNDAVSASQLSGAANVDSKLLGARIFDTSMYGIFGKYAFDLGGRGFQDPSDPRFIVSGGYNHIDFSNPADGGFAPGHLTIGAYELGPAFSTNGSIGGGVVNYAFTGGDRTYDSIFIAGKYQHNEQWSAAVAYYISYGNSFGFGVNKLPGIVARSYSNTACSSNLFSNCSGNTQVISFEVVYDWTKNVRLYAGVAYSEVNGGFAFGYLNRATYDPTVGLRCAF
jgi:predicted porin